MTIVLGAAETDVGTDSTADCCGEPAWLAAGAGRAIGASGCSRPRGGCVRAASPQADLGLAVVQVQRGQVVASHQAYEVMHPLDVERLFGSGRVFGHSFTPHQQTPSPPAVCQGAQGWATERAGRPGTCLWPRPVFYSSLTCVERSRQLRQHFAAIGRSPERRLRSGSRPNREDRCRARPYTPYPARARRPSPCVAAGPHGCPFPARDQARGQKNGRNLRPR